MPDIVVYNVSDLLKTLKVIFDSWYTTGVDFMGWLVKPIHVSFSETFLGIFPEETQEIANVFVQPLVALLQLVFGDSFTILGVLFGGIYPILIVFVFIIVLARWILDIGPL